MLGRSRMERFMVEGPGAQRSSPYLLDEDVDRSCCIESRREEIDKKTRQECSYPFTGTLKRCPADR
eukprot:scaffold770_cov362-Pavlova_lutheri.AAC.21